MLEIKGFSELKIEETIEIDGGFSLKDLIDGINALNDSWDSWKRSFKNGWNSYPY